MSEIDWGLVIGVATVVGMIVGFFINFIWRKEDEKKDALREAEEKKRWEAQDRPSPVFSETIKAWRVDLDEWDAKEGKTRKRGPTHLLDLSYEIRGKQKIELLGIEIVDSLLFESGKVALYEPKDTLYNPDRKLDENWETALIVNFGYLPEKKPRVGIVETKLFGGCYRFPLDAEEDFDVNVIWRWKGAGEESRTEFHVKLPPKDSEA